MKTSELVKKLYKNDKGEPLILTPSQCELFDIIFKKKYPRNHIMTHTRYGKSYITALAILTRVSTFPEKWCIVAPSERKARIIMSYLIEHVFDNAYTQKRLEISKDKSLDRLRRERSSTRLTFKIGDRIGEVSILSAEARRTSDVEEALMGFGSPNLVEDEAALIPDVVHATAMRMLGDQPDNFLVKIGNPFRRNHFLRSYLNPKYHKFVVTYETSIKEGRLRPDFADEMKDEAFFDVMYECKFPDEDAIDNQGWVQLIRESELIAAMDKVPHFGEERIGIDPADSGGNSSVILKRSDGFAEILLRNSAIDTMQLCGHVHTLTKEGQTKYVDRVGVGAGVFSRLKEQGMNIFGVNAGEKVSDKRFYNKKAEMYWRLREWLKTGGRLDKKDEKHWRELLNIRYKIDSGGRIRIIPKIELMRQGIDSPDVADALALTFYNPFKVQLMSREEKRFYLHMKKKKLEGSQNYKLKMA